MYISNEDFNTLNRIALVLVRKVDEKSYDEMCEILGRIQEHEDVQNDDDHDCHLSEYGEDGCDHPSHCIECGDDIMDLGMPRRCKHC